MNVRRRWLLAASVFVIGATMSLAIACSSSKKTTGNATATESAVGTPSPMAETPSGTGTPGATGPGAVHIGEKEYSITGLNGATIESPPAGKVTFEVHNNGTMQHVFYVFKTDTGPANLPLSGNTVDEAKAGTDVGEIDPVPAGSIKTLTIDNLPAGHYVLICNRPGHYQLGMHAAFVVQ